MNAAGAAVVSKNKIDIQSLTLFRDSLRVCFHSFSLPRLWLTLGALLFLVSAGLYGQNQNPGGFPQNDSLTRPDSALRRYLPIQDTSVIRTKFWLDTTKYHRDQFGILRDSTGFPVDTTMFGRRDSLGADTVKHWEVYLDSTARMEQWIHHRSDLPMVEMFRSPQYSLYLNPNSSAYKRELEIDTLGQYVTVRERVNGVDVKVPIRMKLDDYIRMRYEEEKINTWRGLARQYTLKENKDQLAGFLGSLTNITIPMPANPLLDIFGGKAVHLAISGGVDIHGAFRNQSSDVSSISQLDRSTNEPDFNQDVQINVSGTIGDKLNILADWNTQRTFEYENQLKIRYTGYDDEIVQSVEAGNVSLQTPSLVGGGQALFGIKAKLQTGPLTLTTLLSQKKGQTKELVVSGGSTSNDIVINPQEYSTNHFFADTIYRQFYEQLKEQVVANVSQDMLDNQIVQMDVFVSLIGNQATQNQSATSAHCYIDLPKRAPNAAYPPGIEATLSQHDNNNNGGFEQAVFLQLDPNKDFSFDKFSGVINLYTSVGAEQVVAVRYTIAGSNNTPQVYGGVAGGDTTLLLKLIKPRDLLTTYHPAWELMLKNIYPLRITNVKKDGFDLSIWRRPDGAGADVNQINGEYLVTALGLDRFNESNAPSPDNKFDFIPGLTIDPDHGEIIFPTLRPFDTGLQKYFQSVHKSIPDSLLFPDIYDTTQNAAQLNTLRNKYYIKVKAAGAQSSRYSLGFNLVEGSVKVLMNGVPLTPNVDYTVDYIVGEVVIRRPDALLPGANVQVKYEQNDLFQLASKTLIGARGELATFANTNLGFTIMDLNQATLSDKVRLGEEPTNNMIMGVDASSGFNMPFLTDAIDALPGLRTKEMSSIKFGGEFAYILPNSNTKTSTVTSDGNASIAYIDDFEGARRTVPLPVLYSQWSLASAPVHTLLGDAEVSDQVKTWSRARLVWYNNSQNYLPVITQEIWPQRKTRPNENFVSVMNLDYEPSHRGMYNFSPNLDSTLRRPELGGPRKNWAGIMRYIGTTAGNLLDQNITYLEIWAKAIADSGGDLQHGRLFIDLGKISEDAIPNKELNSEDLVKTSTNPNGFPNGVMNNEKDLGLDMLSDDQEKIVYSKFLSDNAGDPDVNPNDPSGDDYQPPNLSTSDPSRVIPRTFNGTEGNYVNRDPSGQFPNTEDLNSNGSVDFANQYLEYEVPLDTVYIDSTNTLRPNLFRVGGGNNGWYQFRIPLLEGKMPGGGAASPQSILETASYIRLWVTGFDRPVTVRIAEMDLVGNQWQERTKNDTVMKVSTVNLEDNLDYAADWAQLGISREKDRTDPTQIIEANEQSLALILNDLPKDSSRQAVKSFNIRPLDVFTYKSMRMFVHGGSTIQYISPEQHDADLFIRFGSDTLNYYEYREPIHPGWDLLNNNVTINFEELTAVKSLRPIDSLLNLRTKRLSTPAGASYSVKGNPSLRQIREISIGVVNVGSAEPLRGQVWVNELRLVQVDNSAGGAYRFDTQVKLADVGSAAFNFSRNDPNFHGIDQRFGSQVTGQNWGVSANFALDRFFPSDWQGTSIPISYSHTQNLQDPKYLPNSDVVVKAAATTLSAPAARDAVLTQAQTLSTQDSYAVSNFRISPPGLPWYLRDTFTKLSMAFNYSRSRYRDPSIATRSGWQWNFKMSYGIAFAPEYFIQPFKNIFANVFLLSEFKDWKLYFMPVTNLSASLGGQRSRSFELARVNGGNGRESRNFGANKSIGFSYKLSENGLLNLAGDYGISMDRNLLPLDNDSIGRGMSSVIKSLFFGGQDSRYGQRLTMNSKPKILNIFDLPKYLDLSAGYGVNYSWTNSFQNGDIGKSAGWDNNMNLSMTFRLKSLVDPWFESKDDGPQRADQPRNQDRDPNANPNAKDTTKGKEEKKPDQGGPSKNIFKQIKNLAKIFIKTPFLDYENIGITYTQGNRSGNAGVLGSTGFKNFWGRLPFQGSLDRNGPSRLYQLGLISDPSGTLKWSPSSSFPFLGWKVIPGRRAIGGIYTDQFGQSNNIALRTNRPLWQGATLDINWKVAWQYSRSTTIRPDSITGYPVIQSEPTTSGNVDRSFLTLPPVLFLKVFKSNLEDVGKKYEALKADSTMPKNVALAQAFEKGMEALPFLNKIFGQYVPRPNWSLRWDGVEKLVGISSFVERMSLEHSYSSNFRRDFRNTQGFGEQTDIERVSYGFAPLAGINTTFKDFLKGNFSGNFRYNTTSSLDLNLQAQPINIVETFSQEISLSLTYARHGFSFPLFGLNLQNDVDISFTFSRTKNSRRRYDPDLLSAGDAGSPLEGSTRTLMEPRIRYVLSTRVTAALFYRFSKTAPDEGGSTIFGTTSNEAGVDIHISI